MAIMAMTPAASWIHRVAGDGVREGLSVIFASLQLGPDGELTQSRDGRVNWHRWARRFVDVAGSNARRLSHLLNSATPFATSSKA
jgi:hypothetical protein